MRLRIPLTGPRHTLSGPKPADGSHKRVTRHPDPSYRRNVNFIEIKGTCLVATCSSPSLSLSLSLPHPSPPQAKEYLSSEKRAFSLKNGQIHLMDYPRSRMGGGGCAHVALHQTTTTTTTTREQTRGRRGGRITVDGHACGVRALPDATSSSQGAVATRRDERRASSRMGGRRMCAHRVTPGGGGGDDDDEPIRTKQRATRARAIVEGDGGRKKPQWHPRRDVTGREPPAGMTVRVCEWVGVQAGVRAGSVPQGERVGERARDLAARETKLAGGTQRRRRACMGDPSVRTAGEAALPFRCAARWARFDATGRHRRRRRNPDGHRHVTLHPGTDFPVDFLPSYLFTALSSFSWVCWIAPNSVRLNQLFGVTHGLAMGVLTFDWGQIAAFTGSPLPTPWWAAANNGIAVVFFSWFLVPILYYTNTWYSEFLPIVSSQTFDNTGIPYNVSRILKDDATFDLDAYKAYSPVFISVTFAIFYCLSFATITSTITHTLIYNRKWIWNRARRQPDIHARLMSVYKEVPDWWYLTIFSFEGTMFGFGVAAIEIWNADLPVWAFILALIIGFASTIPIGIITAMTNQEIGLNVITELIIGYLLPGRPIAMMMFKAWGYITMSQALNLAAAFKLGHYMKIPPRPMFFCQVVATVISGTVQLGVQAWLFSNVEDICSPNQKDGFSCPNTNVFGNASIIWGVIGPQRIFAHGQLYYGLLFFFLIGAVLPIIQWALHKRFKIGLLRYLNFPVIFSPMGFMPPATPINYVPSVLVCFIFNYVIRRRHFGWWTKYNCYAIGVVFIFFTHQYPDNGNIGLNSIQNWWGNTVFLNTADAKGTPFKSLSDGQTFGPESW
ncbi:OPT oligopeptide transporter protein-domain-containing protein [Lactarius quietus]|nr:OPT oligopeptide transporter protein-domain-containing protein [Lactarius quietus]